MKLSRRDVLGGIGAAALLAAINPTLIGSEMVVDGYLKPYGVTGGLMGKYLFSKTPLHCLECFRGDEGALMVVELKQGAVVHPAAKVRLKGVLKASSDKTGVFGAVLSAAQIVKKTFV